MVDQNGDDREVLGIIVSNRHSAEGIEVVRPDELSRPSAYPNNLNGHGIDPSLRNPVGGQQALKT